MSFSHNKVLKVTRWSWGTTAAGNWTISWRFWGWRLFRHVQWLGTTLRFLADGLQGLMVRPQNNLPAINKLVVALDTKDLRLQFFLNLRIVPFACGKSSTVQNMILAGHSALGRTILRFLGTGCSSSFFGWW